MALKDQLCRRDRDCRNSCALGMVASLTTPFQARHPNVRFRIMSCASIAVLGLLENLEVDAGLTYLENEPLGKARSIPLYNESYRLLTAPDGMFGDRDQVTWKEVGAGAAVPADAGHAEPAHHRSRAAFGRGRGDADADLEFAARCSIPM